MLVRDLDYHTGILCKQRLDDVSVLADVVQVDVHAALCVGERHLQQGGDETAGRDVVTCHHPTTVNQFLNGVEGIGKVFSVFHRRHVVPHLAEALRKGRAAEVLLVEREVDVVDAGVLIVHQYGADHLLDVAHLAACRDDDRSRRDNLLTVGVLLAQ